VTWGTEKEKKKGTSELVGKRLKAVLTSSLATYRKGPGNEGSKKNSAGKNVRGGKGEKRLQKKEVGDRYPRPGAGVKSWGAGG